MYAYHVRFVYGRCFLQRPVKFFDDCEVSPLSPTGYAGQIHDLRKIFESIRYPFSRSVLEHAISNFQQTGQAAIVSIRGVIAPGFERAIDSQEETAERAVSAISAISETPAIRLVGFTDGPGPNGLNYYIPSDRLIRHASNIPGKLDALSDLYRAQLTNKKLAALLKLYRSSLRDSDIDNQILFQLIILEEASDKESGNLAQRIRRFSDRIGLTADLAHIASECEIPLPPGKDVVDLLVKLRNISAHNGSLSEATIKESGADWLLPIVGKKGNLYRLLSDVLSYMFCCIVGHDRDSKAVLITEPTVIRFD